MSVTVRNWRTGFPDAGRRRRAAEFSGQMPSLLMAFPDAARLAASLATIGMRLSLVLRRLSLLALLNGAAAAQAQTNTTGPHQQLAEIGDKAGVTHSDAEPDKTSFLVVPIPQSSPTLGSGITLIGSAFYNPNQSREPWVTGLGLLRTSNGSKAIGLAHKMAFNQDKFQITAFGGYADINVKFYGIGPNAGDRDLSITLKEKGYLGLLQTQMRVAKDFYVGPRFMYLDLNSSVKRENPLFPNLEIPRIEFRTVSFALGPSISYDTRDNSYNPRGEYLTAAWLFNAKDLGSDFTYDKFTLSANVYSSLGTGTVLAGHIGLCGVSTGGPFYDLCNYGSNNDLRGYEAGRYRDRGSWATQVELRQHLFGRFGAVAFAGVGGVAPTLSDLDDSKILPAAGAGLRFLASKATGVNLRLDYAVGKGSNAIYFSVGEAF